MGGRGGGGGTPRGPGVGGSPASMSDEERDFRRWLTDAPPINADRIDDDPDRRDKVLLGLPDRDAAYIMREGKGKVSVHDGVTDERLFSGRSDPDLFRQISRHYGVQVKLHDGLGRVLGTFGERTDPRTSPAARKYGV